MPKPLVGDNGSGMHVHQSLQKDGKALFAGDKYGGLSDIGALLHRRHHQARQGDQRLHQRRHQQLQAPGAGLRSAGDARLLGAQPLRLDPHSVGVEPEGAPHRGALPGFSANPYFAFAAMMMAGLDGIQNKIHPGEPADKDLYDLEPEEAKHIPKVCHSLDMALEYLDKDREFLTRGGVFTDDVIDAYIGLKMQEVTRFRMSTHPVELDMYYSV